MLERIVAEHTGQPLENVEIDTDRDFILTADEAVAYGILDEGIGSQKHADILEAIEAI